MSQETLVAVFDTAEHANAACHAIEDSGIPPTDIERHAKEALGAATAPADAKKQGFWSYLFGGETSTEQNTVYERTVQSGGEVVTVLLREAERDADRVMAIIEKFGPVDVSERAASYGAVAAPASSTATSTDQTIQLAEETLAVGKRAVNRGTTRVHRYVTTKAVEENVTLRDETVSVERRAVSGDVVVGADAFTDKTIEMTEIDEEVVVAKSARVREEVVLHKDVEERVETVRENLRREELEIEKIPGSANSEKTSTVAPTTVNPLDPRKPAI